MSQLYSRVFLQILDSSIAEDFTVRHVFEDFLKLCDHKTGVVDMTRQALARRLNIPIDVLNNAITVLESPDINSRDHEFEGRRLKRLEDHRDWGWVILNWEKYETIRSRADVYMRVAKHRETKAKEPLVVVFPENLNSDDFKNAWKDWETHRNEKKKPLTQCSVNKQLSFLSSIGLRRAIAAINHSIANGWEGIFEPKSNQQVKQPKPSYI